MRKHAKSWVGRFGTKALVCLPSWGNIVHGVPVKSMDLTNLSKKEGIIKQLLTLVLIYKQKIEGCIRGLLHVFYAFSVGSSVSKETRKIHYKEAGSGHCLVRHVN
jgi:hypothetical protein